MTGFKSKQAMATGKPYIPKINWQEQLKFWEGELKGKYGWGDSENVKSDCMDLMQRSYPGKYVLEWQKTGPSEYHLVLVFEDPKQETFWKLQYET